MQTLILQYHNSFIFVNDATYTDKAHKEANIGVCILVYEVLNVCILKGGLFSLTLSAVYMHRRQKCKEKKSF